MSAVYTAAAAAVVGVASGIAGQDSARSAARAQQQAQQNALATQQDQYRQTREDQAPWRAAGTQALHRLQNVSIGNMSQFNTSPGYEFRRSEGLRGIQQTAAARGGAFSGNALKALADYNSNIASGEFGNWWNQQAGLAGIGQAATNTTNMFGQQAANNIGNLQTAQGDARASGIIGGQNSLWGGVNGGLQTGLGIYNAYQSAANNYLQPIDTSYANKYRR